MQLFNFADNSLKNYLAHQLTIDQALFLISFYEEFIKGKKVTLCPESHDYKTFLSLDERIKKALERFITVDCSLKCKLGHNKKQLIVATFGSYLFNRFAQNKQ